MTVVANLLDETIKQALKIQGDLNNNNKVCKLVDFCKVLEGNENIIKLKEKVIKFSSLYN